MQRVSRLSGIITGKEKRVYDGGFFIFPVTMCNAYVVLQEVSSHEICVGIPEILYDKLAIGQFVKLLPTHPDAAWFDGTYQIDPNLLAAA